jgi:hypothetical protein
LPPTRERRPVVQVIERAAWRYEAQDEGFGRVYRWYPGYVVIECECGERLTLTDSITGYERGADHATTVQEARSYSWLEYCLERLEGKEAREEYYARLE